MNRRRGGSLAGSPLLIGAITTLIVVVAVYLSYNANNGLPFVPTYNINVELPQTSGLEESNVVRVGGSRVGIVKQAVGPPGSRAPGEVTAIAELKLEKGVEPLPVDTTASVQSLSSIGLKYLQLEKGTLAPDDQGGRDDPAQPGARTGQHRRTVQHVRRKDEDGQPDQLEQRRRRPGRPRAGAQQHDRDAAPAAHERDPRVPQPGRARDRPARAVGRARPGRLPGRLGGGHPGRLVCRARQILHRLGRASPPRSNGRPCSVRRRSNRRSTRSRSRRHSPKNSTEFMRLLRPSARAARLRRAAARPRRHRGRRQPARRHRAELRAGLLRAGAPGLRRKPDRAGVPGRLHPDARSSANPVLAGLAPEQANCNYFTLAFRNLASLTSENIGVGTLTRASLVLSPNGPNNEGFPSSAPANGPSVEHRFHSTAIIDNNHLHANPYPNVTGPGQPPSNCEAGNENYIDRQGRDRQRARRHRHDARTDDPRTEPVRRTVSELDAQANLGLAPDQDEGDGRMKAPRWWRRYDRTPVVELGRTNPHAHRASSCSCSWRSACTSASPSTSRSNTASA